MKPVSKAVGAFALHCYCFLVRLWELSGLNRLKNKSSRRHWTIIAENYLENKKQDENPAFSTKNRLINDQHGTTGRVFRYGDFGADYNACEIIAMHNARVLLGCDSCLSETMRAVQNRGGMFCRGKWGTKLSHIGKIMAKEYGLSVKTIRKIQNINRDGVYIMSFWNTPENLFNGLHTVALRLENGVYSLYNCSRKSSAEPLTREAFRQRYKKGFILAYKISSNRE